MNHDPCKYNGHPCPHLVYINAGIQATVGMFRIVE